MEDNISDILEDRYGKRHLSYSSLKHALGDMAQFDRYMKKEMKFESDALDFGTMYDMLLFDRDRAYAEYIVMSDTHIKSQLSEKALASKKPNLTKEYKDAVKALKDQAEKDGKSIVSQADWSAVNAMIDRLKTCGLVDTYLHGDFQVEFNEEIDGVLVKGFLDCKGMDFITDSKSTRDVQKFKYSVFDFCYDVQAYIYTKVFNVDKFYWVAQDKAYPYLPALIKCSDKTLQGGKRRFDQAIKRIRSFLTEGEEPAKDFLKYEI